jgi:hypothetical protein
MACLTDSYEVIVVHHDAVIKISYASPFSKHYRNVS